MLRLIECIILSYLAGSINPAAIIARMKKTDLRKRGTGNLGATNAMLVFGRTFGVFVMIFDMGKGILAVAMGQLLCPQLSFGGILGGSLAVIGHIFPFYLGFKGGKGLAAFGGMVLALDPYLFFLLLPLCVSLMIITDHSVTLPFCGALFFPLFSCAEKKSVPYLIIASVIGTVILLVHLENLKKALRHEDASVRGYIKKFLHKE